ncbi:Cleavage/polyadenylation specificity factor A subunit C-terminal [Arabidopsis thaliana x Arabidopsis arenosa]|uniref:Cleavage/polyadenylation specificity factor A subunit C-terminal n=1 Tax=Arabidopsis thaliana x Arabidopsis arenosa TaxID=1240361 RepID=A0A8T1Z2G0_9BRAS|nr:Cleavage/polyadenylation specificity factor A subunit C-terminal [Arabidopsis thaliana x Arabidopsis arenosa]
MPKTKGLADVPDVVSLAEKKPIPVKHNVIITPENRSNHTAIQMMENGVLFSSDAHYIIMSHSSVDNMVGRWFSREFITQIKGGTLSRLSDEDYAQVPSVLFSTTTGAVGVIVSLPYEVYSYLKNLEKKMRLARKARKDFVQFKAHDCIGLKDDSHKHFIDGDFLESFMILSMEDQLEIANDMNINVTMFLH